METSIFLKRRESAVSMSDELEMLIGDSTRMLFVPNHRRSRPIRRTFLAQLMAVIFLGCIASSKAVSEPAPGDLISMLDHAAIVEAMARACEGSRADLAAAFRDAQQRWWVRNAQIHETLATLEREIGKPRARAFLDYFDSLQRSLRQEIDDQRHVGSQKYVARCDGVLQELIRGRLDYQRSGAASGAG